MDGVEVVRALRFPLQEHQQVMFWIPLLLMLMTPAHLLFSLRVFNHSDIFTTIAARTIAFAPAWFFIGLGMLIVNLTHWFDTHSISVIVK